MPKWMVLSLAAGAALFISSRSSAIEYYGKSLCGKPGFTCITIKKGDTWESLFPHRRQREIVMHFNRINLPVSNRPFIVVPNNISSLSGMSLSPFPEEIPDTGEKQIIISLNKQAFAAYDEDGDQVRWGPISAARGFCPDVGKCTTVTGRFRIYRKGDESCVSSKYPLSTGGGARMQYCMHFYKGYAMHASSLPGYNASHGCIRMTLEDAKWLNQDFTDIGTRVIVQQD